MVPHERGQGGFVEEVLGLVVENDLRPIATTGYQREQFVGRGTDLGLRVTPLAGRGNPGDGDGGPGEDGRRG